MANYDHARFEDSLRALLIPRGYQYVSRNLGRDRHGLYHQVTAMSDEKGVETLIIRVPEGSKSWTTAMAELVAERFTLSPGDAPRDYFGTEIRVGDFLHWTSWAKDTYGKKQGGRDGIATKITPKAITVATLADARDSTDLYMKSRNQIVEGDLLSMRIQDRRSTYRIEGNPFDTVTVIPEAALHLFNARTRYTAISQALLQEDTTS